MCVWAVILSNLDFLHVWRKRSPNLQMCPMCLLSVGFVGDSRGGMMGYICTTSWSCIFLVLCFAIWFVWLSSSSLGAIGFHFVSRSLFSFVGVDMGASVWEYSVLLKKMSCSSRIGFFWRKYRISHRWQSFTQIWCTYGNKKKIETRNVVHLMVATTFIVLVNMKFWLQD
jgi:hypothetical protein